jgi:predicted porin
VVICNPTSGVCTPGPNRAADQRSTRAWVGYTFAMGLKVGLGWDRSGYDNHIFGAAKGVGSGNASRSAWMIPVSYTFGPHAIYGTYARAGSASGSAIAATTGGDYKATLWTIGYDYAFSKRTSVGVFYTKLNNNLNAAGTAGGAYDLFGLGASGATTTRMGEDARQWYLGMAHSF